ncbi:RND family efflux transporter MFP subunit [Candidatus Nitrosoglobus terrae]|uniref:RND family efflux transporter MFP subunit n=1 Tax=Candidatus Nitrosoglobus terrae TaxID=1630141 RepID=A0A1Q2SNB6_9GAMM|nr:efflux RND transporter periplasmic adaptor subunit [Candidatus Nitrosoglobus terrae]BAW80624.1 RND family efflux transporter MFP subunit [Candidatus Nitrosoglobus terrae]
MRNKTSSAILIVIGIGIVLGWRILQIDSSHENNEQTEDLQVETNKEGDPAEESQIQISNLERNYIKLTPEAQRKAGIQVEAAGSGIIKTTLTLPGEIQLNPRQEAHVVPQIQGIAIEVRKFLGDKVKKGEVLAILQSRDLADLRSQYLVALQQLDLAHQIVNREEILWRERISAKQDYLIAKIELAKAKVMVEAAAQKLYALDLSKADLAEKDVALFSHYRLLAPFTGEVVDQDLSLGESVSVGTIVCTIADLSTVWAGITVYTKDLATIQLGQKVKIKAVNTGLATKGSIFYMGPLVGKQTRSAKAYVEIPNPKGYWRPGLFITAEVLQEEIEIPVTVVPEAIQTYQDHPIVFVQHEGIFEPREIILGRRDSHWVEISEGLLAGERYVTRNSFVLKSELNKPVEED